MSSAKRTRWLLFGVLAAGLAVSGCKGTAQQPPQGGPIEVDVVTLQPQPVTLMVELPGRISPFRIAEVRPQVGGIIQKRLFVEGSEVKAGQLLYQIDPATYQAAFDSAKATLARTEAQEHSARLKAERYRVLVRTKAVSEQDQVEIEAAWKQAVADVAAAKASLASARINLDYTKVIAPISGRIGKSNITEGALVTAQQADPLTVIQQLDPLYVDVNQSSAELLELRKEFNTGSTPDAARLASEVTVLLEDASVYRHTGTLEFSDVTVNPTTGTVTLRAIVANPDQELLPGMFVRARILKGQRPEAIVVPAVGITRNNKGQAVVMVVSKDQTIEARLVQTGQQVGAQVLVTQGLVAGEQVVVAGLQKIKPGVPVKPVEKAASVAATPAAKTE